MIRIGIVGSSRAFLPEVEAYRRYLSRPGRISTHVFASLDDAIENNVDIALLFFGFYPRWMSRRPKYLVADVNSLSTGQFRRMKDSLKCWLNVRPDAAVALNDFVSARGIARSTGYSAIRGMGYFEDYVVERKTPEYDVVYSGTLDRKGIRSAVAQLAALDLRVAIVGSDRLAGYPGSVDFLGRLSLPSVYEVYSRSLCGLNVIPPVSPYQYQDSTKLIEYCAAGLRVITNDYPWVRDFEARRGGRFLRLHDHLTREYVMGFPYEVADVADLEWSKVIARSGIREAVERLVVQGNE